jgi:hypothetical protein
MKNGTNTCYNSELMLQRTSFAKMLEKNKISGAMDDQFFAGGVSKI